MMLYKNIRVKVRDPDGDTDHFNILEGILQEETFAPYLFIIYLDYLLGTSIDLIKYNGFIRIKERSLKYRTQTIKDVNYADDIALLANIPTQVIILLDRLKRVAAGMGLHVNADETEYMCFIQRGDFSTLNGSS